MAFSDCKECGRKVSDDAASCPHCGRATKEPSSQRLDWGGVIGSLIMIAVAALVATSLLVGTMRKSKGRERDTSGATAGEKR